MNSDRLTDQAFTPIFTHLHKTFLLCSHTHDSAVSLCVWPLNMHAGSPLSLQQAIIHNCHTDKPCPIPSQRLQNRCATFHGRAKWRSRQKNNRAPSPSETNLLPLTDCNWIWAEAVLRAALKLFSSMNDRVLLQCERQRALVLGD